MGKVCENCQNSLADDAQFCNRCGAKWAGMACPHCSFALPEDATFCPECGNAVRVTPTAAPREEPRRAPQPEAPVSAPHSSVQQAEPKARSGGGKGKTIALSVLIGLALVALGIFVAMKFISPRDVDETSPEDSQIAAADHEEGGEDSAIPTGGTDEPAAGPATYTLRDFAGYYTHEDPHHPGDWAFMTELTISESGYVECYSGRTVIYETYIANKSIHAATVQFRDSYGAEVTLTYLPSCAQHADACIEETLHGVSTHYTTSRVAPPPTPAPATVPAGSDDYILPTDSRRISPGELYGYSKDEVSLIRNEIYARHNCTFRTEWISDYFSEKLWYYADPDIDASTFSNGVLSDIESDNLETILQFETNMGWK